MNDKKQLEYLEFSTSNTPTTDSLVVMTTDVTKQNFRLFKVKIDFKL